jgi:Na+/proline symporter
MVQRLLAARTQGESRAALLGSWAVIFFQFTLFLFIGAMLFVYYGETGLSAPQPYDRIYPQFIWNNLQPGIAGLVIAAILAAAMSNLSAALNSLASTTVMDFYKPIHARAAGGERSEAYYLRLARIVTVFWGVALFLIGVLSRQVKSVLEAGLGIASIIYGSLLGVFLLGVLTKRVGEKAAMAGMAAGLFTMLYVRFGTQVGWTWYVFIGTTVTFVCGILGSFVWKETKNG